MLGPHEKQQLNVKLYQPANKMDHHININPML